MGFEGGDHSEGDVFSKREQERLKRIQLQQQIDEHEEKQDYVDRRRNVLKNGVTNINPKNSVSSQDAQRVFATLRDRIYWKNVPRGQKYLSGYELFLKAKEKLRELRASGEKGKNLVTKSFKAVAEDMYNNSKYRMQTKLHYLMVNYGQEGDYGRLLALYASYLHMRKEVIEKRRESENKPESEQKTEGTQLELFDNLEQ